MVVPHVVVVGAGFGGVAAAHRLAGRAVRVTLVDRHNYSTFQPLLYQIATSGLDAGNVASSIRSIVRTAANVSVHVGTVVGVELNDRTVAFDDGSRIAYDALILAPGAAVSYFAVAGAEQHAYPIYTLDDALRLREVVLQRFEDAEADPSLVDRGGLSFVVVGGGPTGVEVAGALTELFDKVLRQDFRRIDPSRARVILVEARPTLLAPFRAASQRHANETLAARGVDVRVGTTVDAVTAEAVHLRSEPGSPDVVPAHTTIWTAGVTAGPLAGQLDLPQIAGGRLVVERDLSVPGHPEVFAIGDVAAPCDRRGTPAPQLAPVAIQSGDHAAAQILRRLQGRSTRRFRYLDRGTMATIGRRAAVADLRFGITLSGTQAWLAWLFLHLLYLVGYRRRTIVLLQWIWNYLLWDWGPRIVLDPRARPRRAS